MLTTALPVADLLNRDTYPPVVIDGIERLYVPADLYAKRRDELEASGKHYTTDRAVYDAWKAAYTGEVATAKTIKADVDAKRLPADRMEEPVVIKADAEAELIIEGIGVLK